MSGGLVAGGLSLLSAGCVVALRSEGEDTDTVLPSPVTGAKKKDARGRGGARPPLPPAAQEILTKIVAQQGSWTDGEKTDELPFHATNC